MPTYVYRREDGTTFEVVQRISDEPLTLDPDTGQPVQRVISGAGLIFKGSGFYLTDYVKKGGEKGAEKSNDDSKPVAESTPEKKTEAAAPAAPAKKD
jgi:putative FmdB family regulatory protein